MTIEIGSDAPDFELAGANVDGKLTLSSLRGDKNVALVFFPFALSGICHDELCEVRDDIASFDAEGVQVIAVSCDSHIVQKQWAADNGYAFPVLADYWPHGAVARAYGVFNEDVGCAMRATVLIGKDGKVVDVFQTADLKTPREQARYKEALAKLG